MRQSFDYHDILKQVLDFIAQSGIEPYDQSDIVLDGRLHRFRTRDDRSGEKSGAIVIYTDGWPAGYVQDWRKGIKEYWKYDISGLDTEQRTYFNSEEYRKKCEEQERAARKKREAKQTERAYAAARLWDRLPQAPENHPYLVSKNLTWINCTGLRYNPATKCLAVPLTNIKGEVWSIQWIHENGSKTYFEGASLEGLFWSCWLEGVRQNPKETILLGEGFGTMLKVFELTNKPVVAAMSCHRLMEIAKILRENFPEAKIIVAADNDHKTERKQNRNPGLIYATNVKDSSVFGKPLADNVIFPVFTPDEDGSDWDDYALIHGNCYTADILNEAIVKSSMPYNLRVMIEHEKIQYVNAQDLRTKIFPPIKWAVPGFLPSGLSILGGPPKIGKSILALQLALGVSIGGVVLGKIKVQQGSVLYLSLEDNQRRLQERIRSSVNVDDGDDLSDLTLVYNIPRQHEGGLEFIDWWLKNHPRARLVIIDTLQRFRKQANSKANIYAEDYDIISEIKKLADRYDVAFLILHHLKKVNPKAELNMDWIDLFSGSTGISGSADALFVLKRARSSVHGKLYRTGRDVEEKEFWLKLDGFSWLLEEDAEEFTLPTWKKQVLDYFKDHTTVTPVELAKGYSLSINTAQKNLARVAKEGLIIKTGFGMYEMPEKTKE